MESRGYQDRRNVSNLGGPVIKEPHLIGFSLCFWQGKIQKGQLVQEFRHPCSLLLSLEPLQSIPLTKKIPNSFSFVEQGNFEGSELILNQNQKFQMLFCGSMYLSFILIAYFISSTFCNYAILDKKNKIRHYSLMNMRQLHILFNSVKT